MVNAEPRGSEYPKPYTIIVGHYTRMKVLLSYTRQYETIHDFNDNVNANLLLFNSLTLKLCNFKSNKYKKHIYDRKY